MSSESLHVEAQLALDELRQEELLPFPLVAHKLIDETHGDYTVVFYDSRLNSVIVRWKEGESFKAAVRSAVVARIEIRGGGRLKTRTTSRS